MVVILAVEETAAEAVASRLASMAIVTVGKPGEEAEVVVAVAAASPRVERQFVWAPPVVGGRPETRRPSRSGVSRRRVRGGSPVTVPPSCSNVRRLEATRGKPVWCPKTVQAGAFRSWFDSFRPLLPAPVPPRPGPGINTSKSSRLRSRLRKRRLVWKQAASYIATLVSFNEGRCPRKTLSSRVSG